MRRAQQADQKAAEQLQRADAAAAAEAAAEAKAARLQREKEEEAERCSRAVRQAEANAAEHVALKEQHDRLCAELEGVKQALAAAEQEAARLRQQISEAKASVAEALQFVKAADGREMSKQKKGKKDDLQGFDLNKEEEILKKLQQAEAAENKAAEEEEEEEEELLPEKPKKQNMFTSDMFQKAQDLQSKKSKKKKKAKENAEKAPSGQGSRNKLEEENEDDDNNDEEQEQEEEENDEEEVHEKINTEGLSQEEIEKLVAQELMKKLRDRMKGPGVAGAKQTKKAPKASKEAKEEKDISMKGQSGKTGKSSKAGAGGKKEEKSGKLWHIFMTILLLGFTGFLLYSKYNAEKFQKMARYNRGEAMDEDLYEILEVDTSATSQDIKKQFKKMAVAWHPDKNPGCGQTCNEKFDKIHRAYEILSDPQKRKNYDENSGLFSPIKSKTVSLTVNNYRRLVEESNDIWIIQVYEDGNPSCISIADIWDMVAKSYGGIIKFGRVNAMTQPELMTRLPYHVAFFPTIMAVVPGNYPDIFTWSRYGLDLALKKFIENNIIDYITPINNEKFLEKWNRRHQETKSSVQRKPEVFFITNSDVTPIFYKYAAFQLHSLYDFYQNSFGEANKIRKSLEKSKLDFIVNMDHLKDENREDRYERNNYMFQLNRGPVSELFDSVQEFVKFNTIPELDKHLFAEFCGGTEGFTKNDDDINYDEDLKPSICVLLLKKANNDELTKQIYSIQKYQKVKSQELYYQIINEKPLFENYLQFRFGIVDVNRHSKFRKIMEEFSKKNDHEFPVAIGLIHENGKYFVCEKSADLVDFLEKVEKSDDNLEAYYTSEILQGAHINEYLLAHNENIFTVFYKHVKDSLSDFKIIMTIAVTAVMNKVALKKKFGASVVNGIILYVIIGCALAVSLTYKDLF